MANIISVMKKITQDWFGKNESSEINKIDQTTSERVWESWAKFESLIQLENERTKKYKEYDEMDKEITEIASALDLYADFIVSGGSSAEDVYKVEAETADKRVNDVIESLEKRLELKERVWSLARDLAKFGDVFREVVISPDRVVKLAVLPPQTMFRNYKDDNMSINEDLPYVQKDSITGQPIARFEPWEIAHFIVGEEDYGVDESTLARVRRTYKIVRMLEDSILVGRLTRAHQRLVYRIDVSNMGVAEGFAYIEKLKNMYKTRRYADAVGNLRAEKNPLQPQEDIWLPVRKDRTTGVDVIGGDSSVTAIADIEHFHNKLFAGMKVPKAYLGFERDVNAKATLTQQHLAFTKVVRRFRGALAKGLRHIYKVEFLMNGMLPNDFDWRIKFPGIGSADDELRWSIESMKINIIKGLAEIGIGLPIEWVLRHMFLDLSPAEVDEIVDLWKKDSPTIGQNPLKQPEQPQPGAGGGTADMLAQLMGGGAPAQPAPPQQAPDQTPQTTESRLNALSEVLKQDLELQEAVEKFKQIKRRHVADDIY